MICIWHNNRLDWLGLAQDFVYPILVGMWLNRVGKAVRPKKSMKGFSFLGQSQTEMAREAGKIQEWGAVVSIFEMDQN